jgi:type II secretory pathway pseudopilin PulG
MDVEVDKIRFSLPAVSDERFAALLAERLGEASRADAVARIEAQLGEARDEFRYYGNLRGQIAWLPAVITFTVFNIILQIFGTGVSSLLVIFMAAALVVILLSVWLIQFGFQRRQKRANLAAGALSDRYEALMGGAAGATGMPVPAGTADEAKSYRTLRREVRPGRLPDGASWGLLVFFALLVAAQLWVASGLVTVPAACAAESLPARILCVVRADAPAGLAPPVAPAPPVQPAPNP